MRIVARDPLRIGQVDGVDQLPHARRRIAHAMDLQHLGDLVADPHQRIERGHRLLEDHADAVAAQQAHLRWSQRQQVAILEGDAAARDSQRRRQESHDGGGGDRLAGAAFAHDAEDLAGLEIEAYILDRIGTVGALGQRDGEVADREQAHRWRASRGFMASLSPSPTRLSASTVRKMASPGNTLIHQAMRITLRPAPIMKPQDIRLGSPSPRNDRPLSSRMALATIRLASTMMGESALGRISRKMIAVRERPSTSAACTNSRERSDRNSARMTRATGGQETMAMAATIEAMLGEKIATRTTASRKLGTVWKNSVKRMMASSTAPPA